MSDLVPGPAIRQATIPRGWTSLSVQCTAMIPVHLGGDLTYQGEFVHRFMILTANDDGTVAVIKSTPSRTTARTTYETAEADPLWLLDRDDPDDHVIATTYPAINVDPDTADEPDVLPVKGTRPRIDHNPADPRHGTASGYQNNQCRCRRCTDANTDAVRQARQAREAKRGR